MDTFTFPNKGGGILLAVSGLLLCVSWCQLQDQLLLLYFVLGALLPTSQTNMAIM
jgi:hypothetical protein